LHREKVVSVTFESLSSRERVFILPFGSFQVQGEILEGHALSWPHMIVVRTRGSTSLQKKFLSACSMLFWFCGF